MPKEIRKEKKEAKAIKKEIDKPDFSRSEEVGFKGGLPINLDRQMDKGGSLKDRLVNDIDRWLQQELNNQAPLIEKLKKWDRQYRGYKQPKSYPFAGCSNTAIPITRINVEALLVRIFDAVWSQVKVFIIKAKNENFVPLAPKLEDGIEWWQRLIKLKKKLFSPFLQGMKMGTGIAKLNWMRKKRTIYRYATEEEIKDKNIPTFKLANGQYGVKMPITEFDGPDVLPISREDFVISSEATGVQDAFLVGFRTYVRKEVAELRGKQKIYFPDEVKRMVSPDEYDDVKKERARISEKEISDYGSGVFGVWELWFKYDVDEDGEPDDVVITYYPASKAILRAIYNPFFSGFRPFIAFVGRPTEYAFDGEGACQILEKLAEEIDTIHNQRIDRMNQINSPMIFVRAGAGLDDFELAPGKVKVVDDDLEAVVKEVPFHDVYHSTFTEEALLNNYAKEVMGITPQVLGQSVAERPVARETFALIQEANKKFKFLIDNIRDCLSELGMMVIEMIAQYQPNYRYYIEQEGGYRQETIQFPLDYLRDGISIDLTASSEMLNQEVRREINLTIYQLVSDYYTRLAGMMQAIVSPQVPSDFKMFLLKTSQIGGLLLERIIRDFNQPDAESLVINIDEAINVEKALMQSVDMMQQQQMMPAGAPTGAQGGMQGGMAGQPQPPPQGAM